jgi:hypothetical protein
MPISRKPQPLQLRTVRSKSGVKLDILVKTGPPYDGRTRFYGMDASCTKLLGSEDSILWKPVTVGKSSILLKHLETFRRGWARAKGVEYLPPKKAPKWMEDYEDDHLMGHR